MLLDLSIGQRLTLGFLAAALIATLVASLVGVLRSQALSRQSDFYQHLLQVNTSLTTGANFLQLMHTAVHTHLDTADTTTPPAVLSRSGLSIQLVRCHNGWGQVLPLMLSSQPW